MKTNTNTGLRFETIKEIEIDLETRFKQYALARPEEFFSRTDAGFHMESGAFLARIQAAIKRENAALIDQYVHQRIVKTFNEWSEPTGFEREGQEVRQIRFTKRDLAELQASLNTEAGE